MNAAPHLLVTAAIIALVGWRLYARIRRNIGRQHFTPWRSWTSVTLFPLLILLLALALRFRPPLMGTALAGGLVLGVALGLLGLRLTRFESTPEGMFYIPSAHLGVALSLLLVCRIAYRFFAAGGIPGAQQGGSPVSTHMTPLTLVLIGTLAAYYATYALGLLRWSRRSMGTAREGMPP
jgi:hypothetical protein